MGDNNHVVSSSSPSSPAPPPECKHLEVKEVCTEAKSRHSKKVVKIKVCVNCSKVLRKFVSMTYHYECNNCFPPRGQAAEEDWTDSDNDAELAHGLSFSV